MNRFDHYYIWKKGSGYKLTANFHCREFECNGCEEGDIQFINVELVAKLQEMREMIGRSITITSGYRSTEYQQKLRASGIKTAAKTSQHELGNAADIAITGMQTSVLAQYCRQYFSAIGTANSFVHVDTRKDRPREWSY